MGTSLFGQDRRSELERESTLGTKSVESSRTKKESTPKTFLDRCKAVISSNIKATIPAITFVPAATKARATEFNLKVRQMGALKRKLELDAPETRVSAARKTEIILGGALVVIAILMLNDSNVELAALNGGWQGIMALMPFEKTHDMGVSPIAPALTGQHSETETQINNNSLPCSSFHSFADPSRRFAFDQEDGWTANSRMSTQAACGVANHLQQHVPSMVSARNESTSEFSRAPFQSEQRNLLRSNDPQNVNVHGEAFEKYVNSNRMNPGAMPLTHIINKFRNMSQALNDACGPAPSGEGENSSSDE